MLLRSYSADSITLKYSNPFSDPAQHHKFNNSIGVQYCW